MFYSFICSFFSCCLLSFVVKGQCPDGYEKVSTSFLKNGSFEQGNTGFRTAYEFSYNDTYPEGRFSITTNPSKVHPHFAFFGDHTSGNGNMLVVNGFTSQNKVVWEQTIEVKADHIYLFSGWISTVAGADNPANLDFYINNKKAIQIQAPHQTSSWDKFYRSWISGKTTTTVKLSIVNNNITAGGNDFALDDLTVDYCKPVFASLPQDDSFYAQTTLKR